MQPASCHGRWQLEGKGSLFSPTLPYISVGYPCSKSQLHSFIRPWRFSDLPCLFVGLSSHLGLPVRGLRGLPPRFATTALDDRQRSPRHNPARRWAEKSEACRDGAAQGWPQSTHDLDRRIKRRGEMVLRVLLAGREVRFRYPGLHWLHGK